MKITIENTDKIVVLVQDGKEIQARIWQGQSESGVEVHCYVTRIAVADGQPDSAYTQFASELRETVKAREEIKAIPLRLIL